MPRSRRSSPVLTGVGLTLTGGALAGAGWLAWQRFRGEGGSEPLWNVGDRVVFLQGGVEVIGTILSRARSGSSWVYDIQTPAGPAFDVPEADIIRMAIPDVTGGIGLWDFSEGSGSLAADRSGNGNDLSIAGGGFWEGGALRFTGSTEASAPNAGTLTEGGDKTVTSRVWFDDLINEIPFRWPRICQMGDIVLGSVSDSRVSYLLAAATNPPPSRAAFYIEIGSQAFVVRSNTVLTPGQWYNIAGVRQGTQLRVYIDGILDGTAACGSGSLKSVGGRFNVGHAPQNSDGSLVGLIDDLRVYNRALTDAEIATIALNLGTE